MMKRTFLTMLGIFLSWTTAQAQNTISIPVGNLDSTNTLIETTSEVIVPAPLPPIPDMQPLPNSPNVDVAPPPNRFPEPESMDTDLQINQTMISD